MENKITTSFKRDETNLKVLLTNPMNCDLGKPSVSRAQKSRKKKKLFSQQETDESSNLDLNALQENEDASSDSSEDGDNKHFQKLHEFLKREENVHTIDVPVKVSVAELLLLLVKFALINTLPLSAVASLFMLINCMFARPIIPESRYLIDKLFNPLNLTTFHGLCTQFGIDVGTFSRTDSHIHCNLCNIDINIKDPMYNDFFVTVDPSSQISHLLETNSEYYNSVMNGTRTGNLIRDIHDGKLYRRFVKSLHPSIQKNYVSVTFNTDGAPLFESSSYSIWPIYIMLNEVPISIRTKQLMVVGLWFGKNKSNMNIFLKPFVKDMNKLSDESMKCKINSEQRILKVFCLVCCVDSVARAPMQGLVQFNGQYGCNWCLHPGQWVEKDDKLDARSHKYPLLDSRVKRRNESDTLNHMTKGTEKQPCFGFKNPSQLINLKKFHIIEGFVPDNMHIISGVGKQFENLWFGSSKVSASFIDKQKIDEINDTLETIKAPHQIGRLTRSLKDKEFWKAREWENWTLYYSILILHYFSDRRYVLHWVKLVEALYILSKVEISLPEIDRADLFLHEFVIGTQDLYSKFAMTYNVHILLHLAKSVLSWGPLFCHSAFAFESGNCTLLKVIHAAKGVHQQVCRHINLHSSYIVLQNLILPQASSHVQKFCKQLGTSDIKHTIKFLDSRYFGRGSTINATWIGKLELSNRARSYKKMVKDGCLYLSSTKDNKRSDNAFANLLDGCYIKILNFVIDPESKKHYVLCHKLRTRNAFRGHCQMLQKVVSICKDEIPVQTANLSSVCVHMNIRDDEYVCTVPNLSSY